MFLLSHKTIKKEAKKKKSRSLAALVSGPKKKRRGKPRRSFPVSAMD